MPLFNIVDRRSNEFNPFCDAVFEVFAENWADYDLPRDTKDFTEWLSSRSVYDYVGYAMRFSGRVTLFLYDQDGIDAGIHPKIKQEQLDPIGYDERFLRRY